MLTLAKLLSSYLVVGIYKRTWQGALATLLLYYYGLKSLEWDRRTTLVLSNTRELNRDPFTK